MARHLSMTRSGLGPSGNQLEFKHYAHDDGALGVSPDDRIGDTDFSGPNPNKRGGSY
jgi:hypothetical protein